MHTVCTVSRRLKSTQQSTSIYQETVDMNISSSRVRLTVVLHLHPQCQFSARESWARRCISASSPRLVPLRRILGSLPETILNHMSILSHVPCFIYNFRMKARPSAGPYPPLPRSLVSHALQL